MATVLLETSTTTRTSSIKPPVPKRQYPGALVVVEGIDGSGKSTQLYLLKRWLEIGGYRIHFTEWNSSPLVKSATRRGKQRRLLTPTTFSLLHAADFADRCERQILPLLHGGYLVLADRYIYTAFARDAARGCSPHWLRNLYSFAPIPDITFYFRAPLDVAVNRIVAGRPKLKYYEAGMDLGISLDRAESFRIFQERILSNYDSMVDSDNFVLMDGTVQVNKLQKLMRQVSQRQSGTLASSRQRNRDVGKIDNNMTKNGFGERSKNGKPSGKAKKRGKKTNGKGEIAFPFLRRSASGRETGGTERDAVRSRRDRRLRALDANFAADGMA